MSKKRLTLEIFDPVGNLVRRHHFDYEATSENVLILTMENGTQVLDYKGKPIKK